jgi:hypothetical protein
LNLNGSGSGELVGSFQRQWEFVFHKSRGIFSPDERLSVSQKELCFLELVNLYEISGSHRGEHEVWSLTGCTAM